MNDNLLCERAPPPLLQQDRVTIQFEREAEKEEDRPYRMSQDEKTLTQTLTGVKNYFGKDERRLVRCGDNLVAQILYNKNLS